MGLFRTHRNYAALFIRLALAAVFLPHGLDKLVVYEPFGWEGPQAWEQQVRAMLDFPLVPDAYKPILAQVSAWTEAGEGAACLLGLLVRLAVLPLIGNMAVAIALVHWKNGFRINHTLDGVPAPGFEYCMVIILMCLGMFFSGAGSLSLDKLVASEPDYEEWESDEYDEYEEEWDEEPEPAPRRSGRRG
jgi:putative oxidoreductase